MDPEYRVPHELAPAHGRKAASVATMVAAGPAAMKCLGVLTARTPVAVRGLELVAPAVGPEVARGLSAGFTSSWRAVAPAVDQW